MNKKLTLLLTSVLFSILPTMASDWVDLSNAMYVDMNVEKYYFNGYNYSNYYSVWMKYLNNCGSMFKDFNTGQCRKDIDYVLVQYILNCDNNKFGVKGFVRYNGNAQVVDSHELKDYQIEWYSPPPDTVVSAVQKYACQYTNMQKGNK